MGIPSYFSHIVKKYASIMSSGPVLADNLYLDSNSIIYDVVASLEEDVDGDINDIIMQRVCERIEYYLKMVSPSRVMIAFDGVPPMAKIKQQRDRRYKGWIASTKPSRFNTIQITPGTEFMNQLDIVLHAHFKSHENKYAYFKLTTSKDRGEGEHKIFELIRSTPEYHSGQSTMIYGLDSDLIVLGLNHLPYGRIRLLRENARDDEKSIQVLDLALLAQGIRSEIGQNKLPDYIFMTLLLGNDFMPHFPGLNIRTSGFDTLFKTYLECISDDECIYNGKTVNWELFKTFITALSVKEHGIILNEYNDRNRRRVDVSTPEKRDVNMPMIQRGHEYFINPKSPGWQKRYYQTLFKASNTVDAICSNYIDMLQWNIDYYTIGCCNWAIHYDYAYPPLLIDLATRVPSTVLLPIEENSMPSEALLTYVLPPPYHNYIPNQIAHHAEKPTLMWAYCRFTWESHVLL